MEKHFDFIFAYFCIICKIFCCYNIANLVIIIIKLHLLHQIVKKSIISAVKCGVKTPGINSK